MLDFLNIRVLDIIDIFLVSTLIYYIYKLSVNSVATYIFFGIVSIYVFWKLVLLMRLDLLSEILGKFMSVGFITLVIVFQKEIRNFLTLIGTSNLKSKNLFLKKINRQNKQSVFIKEITKSLIKMSKDKVGALIVIEKNNRLNYLIETGDLQNIKTTHSIIESIFYPNSPLHDGAIIISNGFIMGTRIILPISKNTLLPAEYGMRHRAGIGLTEETDAYCLLVSEETGSISLAKEGIAKKLPNNEREILNILKEIK